MGGESDEWFDVVADAVLIVDEGGTIRRASASCRTMLGYTPNELRGQPVELLVPEQISGHAQLRRAFHTSPRTRSMGKGTPLFARHKDGNHVPVDIALSPCRYEDDAAVIAAVRDMSAQQELQKVLRLQSLALEAAANGVVITDRDGTITWCNPAFSSMTGYPQSEIVGEHTRVLKSGAHAPEFYRALWNTVLQGEPWSGEIINRRRDGSVYHEDQMITPVTDERGDVTHFIAIKQDVTERRNAAQALHDAHKELAARVAEIEELNRQLREQAIRDPLTGLFNRRYFDETMHRERQRLLRTREPLGLVMIDLDHFKNVNDAHGHSVGDRVLKAIGELLRTAVRASDLPCRFGGEEFLVALPGATAQVASERAQEWLRRMADSAFEHQGVPVAVTFSAGVAELTADDDRIDAAVERADAALYAAKRAGRNRVVVAPTAG